MAKAQLRWLSGDGSLPTDSLSAEVRGQFCPDSNVSQMILCGTVVYYVNGDGLTSDGWYVEKGSAVYAKRGLKPCVCFEVLPQIPTL